MLRHASRLLFPSLCLLSLACSDDQAAPACVDGDLRCGTACSASVPCEAGLYCGGTKKCEKACVLGDADYACAAGGTCDGEGRCTPASDAGGTGGGTGGTGTGGVGGSDAGTGGQGTMGDAGECDDTLTLILRDFTADHPDFEGSFTSLEGIVEVDLGADKKPVYAHPGATAATTGPDEFDQWYRDVDGVNMRIEQDLQFTETSPGVFVYDNSEFFPLDGMGFGNGPPNDSYDHNYLFTTEAHTLFTYKGGEVFTFRGDDDLWIFINDKLAVDIGGLHTPVEKTIDLDAAASQLGITVGDTYPMDIFHAERHTVESNFRIETTIDLSCIENVEVNPQ